MNRSLTHLLLLIAFVIFGDIAKAQSKLIDIAPANGRYAFGPTQVPDQIVSINAVSYLTGYNWQWQKCSTIDGTYQNISGATAEVLSLTLPLDATTYFKRLGTKAGITLTSNIVRYELAGSGWEDLSYIREHIVLKSGKTTWLAVDALPIGDKLVSTTYYDGLSRPIQTVEKETATPVTGSSTWGDVVQQIQYDNLGRTPKNFLPYTTTSGIGSYKVDAPAALTSYYTSKYNDASPFSQTVYDASPLNREMNQKAPGTAWAANTGNSRAFFTNVSTDDVKRFVIGSLETDRPVLSTLMPNYAVNTLAKVELIDELGKKVVQFLDDNGQIVLSKVQLADAPTNAYTGWICTYYVYDDYGRLRCEINPEGVKWLQANAWNFNATNGPTVFTEQCHVFSYDSKGRTVYKKQPGQQPLRMVYDLRDRLVLTQDGNQRIKSPAEWTAYIYDDLDRVTTTALYKTNLSWTQLNNIASPSAQPVISASDLANTSICTILSNFYYDNYGFANVAAFDAQGVTNATIAPSGPDVLPIVKTNRVTGFPTGKRTLVLGTSTYLVTTNYYDEKGSAIQTLSTNIKAGTDVTTVQYGWDGRILGTASKHSMPGGEFNNYYTLTKFNYDKIGRLTSQEKKFGTNTWRTISTVQFDDLGRISNKRLDPNYSEHFSGIGPAGGGLENLAYTYNVQGRLIAINKDYALKENGWNKWSGFFGIYLSYADASNTTFNTPGRLNGQLKGQVWNTQGDSEQRKYDFSYDNAGRLKKAEFMNRPNPWNNWSNTALDFSEGYSTTNDYDLNGNLTVLSRKGVQLGNNAPVIVDNLRYTYENFSNKLRSVTDITSLPATATVGDFKDVNTSSNDYTYDENGNLVTDLNKRIKNLDGARGVKYNHLDKPEEIKVDGKGIAKITYDADGNRLKREFANSVTGATKITWYLGEYQYEEVVGGANPKALAVEFIAFGEGRIRPIVSRNENNGMDALHLDGNLTLPNGKKGSIDYFISDHRTDVRMVLTEEKQWSYTTASMETANGRDAVEAGLYGSLLSQSRVPKSEVPGWTANTSQFVSKLNSTNKTGPNQLLKVMAGDLLSTNVQYYYQQTTTNTTGSTVFSSVLATLMSSITGSPVTSAATKAASASIIGNLNSGIPFSQVISPDIISSTGNLPKAYLNLVFFDERFNFVSEGSTSVRVGGANTAANLALTQVKVPKNGYCYVYISNESLVNVFFDNLQVRHDRGRIVEENHYYSFGLKIEALSSRAFAGPANNYLYQGDYAEYDDDLGWTDFLLRSYDAQIGRFLQNDPYDEYASGYVGMGNDPSNLVDPTGGCVYCETLARAMTLPSVTVTAVKKAASKISTFMAVGEFALGTMGGIGSSLSSGYDYITKDFWRWETHQNFATLVGTLAISQMSPSLASMNTLGVDMLFNTNFHGTYNGVSQSLDNFVANLPNMSAYDWGRLSGQVATSFFGAKGLDKLGKLTRLTLASRGGWMGKSTILGADRATMVNASRMIPEEGVHQVLLHGTAENFIINGRFVSAKDVARMMLQSGFKKGTTIRLISCHTGVYADGAAYQLSRYLRSPVIAPTNRIKIMGNGDFLIDRNGKFRTFFNTTIK